MTNPDRVSPPIITRASILAVVGVLAALGVDLNISEDQAGVLADAALIVLPLAGSLAGAIWGAVRARQHVTPVLPGDVPRDLQGRPLVPALPEET
jgi:hypothetical protein